MSDSEKAKKLFLQGGYTCVFCKDDKFFTSTERGVKPLLDLLEGAESLKNFSASDKVVGKAAAFLYVLLEVREVYAEIISEPAKEVLQKNKIQVTFGKCVKAIRNRSDTGFCPMETAVMEIHCPEEALEAIKKKLIWLSKNK